MATDFHSLIELSEALSGVLDAEVPHEKSEAMLLGSAGAMAPT